MWPSSPPESIPFPQSKDAINLAFDNGNLAHYGGADTW